VLSEKNIYDEADFSSISLVALPCRNPCVGLITAVKGTKSFPRLCIKVSPYTTLQTGAVSLAIARDRPAHPAMPTPK